MAITKNEEKRQDLLMRLQNIIVDNPISVNKLAIQIGLHDMTLASFLRGNRETTMMTMAKIEKYVLSKEKE